MYQGSSDRWQNRPSLFVLGLLRWLNEEHALKEAVRAAAADVLVVRGTEVRASTLDAGSLSLVVRAGAGYNTIDVAAASRRGIYVANCPGKNSIAVAELAFGLILSLDRHIPANAADLKAGRWNKKEYGKARGLFGRTLVLIGVGKIGQEMITRAKSFGMPVVAWSRSLTPERAEELGIEMKQSPVEVASSCDERWSGNASSRSRAGTTYRSTGH